MLPRIRIEVFAGEGNDMVTRSEELADQVVRDFVVVRHGEEKSKNLHVCSEKRRSGIIGTQSSPMWHWPRMVPARKLKVLSKRRRDAGQIIRVAERNSYRGVLQVILRFRSDNKWELNVRNAKSMIFRIGIVYRCSGHVKTFSMKAARRNNELDFRIQYNVSLRESDGCVAQ